MIERLAWPLTVAANGRMAVVEQDSPEDIVQCIGRVLSHRPGDRTDLPDMGVADPVFLENPADLAVGALLDRYEPRAAVSTSIDMAETIANVTVNWEPGNR